MFSTNKTSHKPCPLCGPRNPLTIVNRLEAVISASLYVDGTMPTNANAALALGMSSRTLARALTKEGTSFNEVAIQLRKQIALSCLKDGRMSISQIGWQLGFDESSSFTHAFKRWFGVAPSEFRSNKEEWNENTRRPAIQAS